MEIEHIFILLIIILLVLNFKRIFFYFKNYNHQKEIDFKKRTNLELWKLRKISSGIFMFGLEKYFINNSDFYFDEKKLYLIKTNQPVIEHSISDIIEVSKTLLSINKCKVWKIIINDLNEQIVYKIITNDSLSNNNFNLFLDKVNENSDSIVDSNWLW
ncbi:hypothetical protein [Flavobacterium sp. K5-23]|uniref:hypothetical protein n=1 Tax=Flavobacterium sp. K5-23 TaxID=2746225 RepID=UPI00200E0046|nr:hypothetical protein [Flavobacterium sp. K5-23]UQD56405.1 hypothetical protein FLAK523_08430 [Flavobacterium sp. K5-23]